MAARILMAAWWLPIVVPIWLLRFAWKFRGFRKIAWLVVQVLLLCGGVMLFAAHPNQMLAAATSQQGMALMIVLAFLMGRTHQGRRRGAVAYQHTAPVVREGWKHARPHVEEGAKVIHLASRRAQWKLRHRVVLGYMAVGERLERLQPIIRDNDQQGGNS